MTGDPVAHSLRKRIVIKRMYQITHATMHDGYWVYQPLVMNELRPKEANIPRRYLHMAKLATLKEIPTANAIGDETGIRIDSDGVEFGSGFVSKTFVSVDYEKPRINVGNFADPPCAMKTFIPPVRNGLILVGSSDHARTKGASDFLGTIGTVRVIDDNVRARRDRLKTAGQIRLLIFCKY